MVKRIFDIVSAVILLLVFMPILSLLLILIKWKLGSPVFFKQVRPGKNEKPFVMFKFRTMLDAVDKNGKPLPDEVRLTPFGKKLRATSVDELPELWNVLKGEMSLVGPRPLLMEYLPLYNEKQKRRHEVKPGITGWAQINGRNAISWADKFQLDIWYVENQSFWLDIKILLFTFIKVIKRQDINSNTHVTVEDFDGTN